VGLFNLRGFQYGPTLGGRTGGVVQEECRQVIVFGKEIRRGKAQGFGQLFDRPIAGLMRPLLVLIHTRAGHGFIQARQDAEPALRQARAFTRFAQALGNGTTKSISGTHGTL
jgi:hypothetical protein